MQPKFDAYQERCGAELLCPSCGFNYLHHEQVEIFEREEDQEHCIHVSVAEGKATIDTSPAGNPSSRRHGLRIHFSCEGCSARPILTIAQHKGNTLVDFE